MNPCKATLACTCAQTSCLLRRIVDLLECEITKHNIPRILDMLYNFISATQYGIYVSDLIDIMRLLEMTCDRFNEVSTFKDVLNNILNICKIPPFMKLSSDVLRYTSDVREFFSVLGYLLLIIQDIDIQRVVINVIICLLETPARYKNQVPLEVRRKQASASRLPGLLGQSLMLVNDELFFDVLILTFKLAVDCPDSCKDLATNDALNSLFTRMECTWRCRFPRNSPVMTEDPVFVHLNTILAVAHVILIHLNAHKEILKEVPVITRFSLWNIKYIFHYVTVVAKWPYARNNLATCIICIMDMFPTMEFIQSGLAEVLLTDGYTAAKRGYDLLWQINESEENFYFVKVFLFSLQLFVTFPYGKFIIERGRIVSKTLNLISTGSTRKTLNELTSVIKILAFKLFNKIVPELVEEFMENSGPFVLLNVLKNTDTSKMGVAVAMNVLDSLRYAIKTDATKCVSNSIVFNNGIDICIEFCKKTFVMSKFNKRIQLCLEEIFDILSILFNNVTDPCNLDMFELVEITLILMDRFLHPKSEEPIYDYRILINVMHFIWEVIIRYQPVYDLFLKRNGVYLMLDILQAFPLPVQLVTLGALVDLCDCTEGKCIPQLITWKGKDGVTLIPLLMEIFRNENKLLEVRIGQRGEIQDTDHPLMGEDQYNELFKKNFKMSPTLADMHASCRPKIYALLNLINGRYRNILNVANEVYRTCNEDLNAKDKMTLLLAENYLGLKLGEAWEELKYEFEQMEFEPLSIDSSIISSLIQRTHRWGYVLKELQIELLYSEKLQDFAEEYNVYNKLQNSHITKCMESLNDAKYIARCTERMFRIADKLNQIDQVEKSMKKIDYRTSLHKTFMASIPVTCVFKQQVSMKTDFKTQDPNESEVFSSLMRAIGLEEPEKSNVNENKQILKLQ